MDEPQIRFDDGAAYEEFMGKWSRLVGDTFLQWLAPPAGQRWVDVGCGNGAFTELLYEHCAPNGALGVDPSQAQLEFARARGMPGSARFELGDAMALPCADRSFDAAVMALVLFFVPAPAQGLAEMRRVVRPGGNVSAYLWDFFGGGFPIATVHQEMTALGLQPLWPPSVEASRLEAMHALWVGAGLTDVATRTVEVQRSFDDFDDFWRIAQAGPGMSARLAAVPSETRAQLRQRVQARMPVGADGRLTCTARANAVKGVVPG